jgi:hypothetical protein
MRCTATAKRSGLQCGRPALKASRTQKCQFHGGRHSGPKTPEGRQRIAEANTRHGEETTLIRAERSRKAAYLAQLEDAMRLLDMTTGPSSRGRKPAGYAPLKTIEQVRALLLGEATNRADEAGGDD